MAESEITVQVLDEDGLTPSFEAANADGNYFANGGKAFLYVKNANISSARTVTVKGQTDCNHGVLHDRDVTVPADDEIMIPCELLEWFNSNGETHIEYSTEADLTVAVISLP